jgi:hypothetical protein
MTHVSRYPRYGRCNNIWWRMKDRIFDNTVDKEVQVTRFAQIQHVNIKDEDLVLPLPILTSN